MVFTMRKSIKLLKIRYFPHGLPFSVLSHIYIILRSWEAVKTYQFFMMIYIVILLQHT